MKNTIFQKKIFLKELTSLAKEMALVIKGASSEEIKEHHTSKMKINRLLNTKK